jgi:Na+-driven multidrug efflux pump
VGDSLTPLVFQSAGVVITAILDPVLMLGWFGFPKFGLNGTAYAMLFAQTVTIVSFFIYLQRKKHILSPDWRRLHLHWPISKLTLKIGAPAAVQQLLVSLGSSIILLFVNQYHTAAVAGYGAASQIDMVAFFITMSFSMAMSTLAGQNIGAQRHERVRQTFWWGLAMSGGLTLLISVIAIGS